MDTDERLNAAMDGMVSGTKWGLITGGILALAVLGLVGFLLLTH